MAVITLYNLNRLAIILCKLDFMFLYENSKKQGIEPGTNFVFCLGQVKKYWVIYENLFA